MNNNNNNNQKESKAQYDALMEEHWKIRRTIDNVDQAAREAIERIEEDRDNTSELLWVQENANWVQCEIAMHKLVGTA